MLAVSLLQVSQASGPVSPIFCFYYYFFTDAIVSQDAKQGSEDKQLP